jgi:hypothetical protein
MATRPKRDDAQTVRQGVVVKSCRIGAVLFALVWLAACATNGTVPAADRLAHSAEAFTTTACASSDVCFDARYFTAAERFTDQAGAFREMADTGTPLQILSSFEHLWHGYHKLRHEVSRSGNDALETDFEATTRAFRDVQQCVKQWYSDRDPLLLIRGGYAFDPYYN